MKILQYPAYITINNNRLFSRSSSGYGYMTLDIATSIASLGVEVDLLTQSNITFGLQYKNVNILRRTWWDIISNINISNIFDAFKVIFNDHLGIKMIPNIVLYYISMGYFEKVLKFKKYDLIHIHGIGHYTLPIIEVCERKNIKYIVTLHGLNSFCDSIKINKREKEIEKQFLKNVIDNYKFITVISTGIKNIISNYFNINNLNNILVIPNGCNTNIVNKESTLKIKEIYNISEDKKVFVCVGSINPNKNQFQIIRAYSALPEFIRNQIYILFLGSDTTNGHFQTEIRNSGYTSNLIYCGYIPREDLDDYYKQADYNIVASISEGFGLSMIEGFVYGLPCLTFDDLDAIPDLYNEKSMLLVSERNDKELANCMVKMIIQDWNKSFVQEYSKQFSLQKMANNYILAYNQLIHSKIL